MTNYYNKMIAMYTADFQLTDRQEFKIADEGTGMLLGDTLYRFNGTNFEYFNTSKNTWIVSNTKAQGLFSGDWIPRKVGA